jgi:hypothetical protein
MQNINIHLQGLVLLVLGDRKNAAQEPSQVFLKNIVHKWPLVNK